MNCGEGRRSSDSKVGWMLVHMLRTKNARPYFSCTEKDMMMMMMIMMMIMMMMIR